MTNYIPNNEENKRYHKAIDILHKISRQVMIREGIEENYENTLDTLESVSGVASEFTQRYELFNFEGQFDIKNKYPADREMLLQQLADAGLTIDDIKDSYIDGCAEYVKNAESAHQHSSVKAFDDWRNEAYVADPEDGDSEGMPILVKRLVNAKRVAFELMNTVLQGSWKLIDVDEETGAAERIENLMKHHDQPEVQKAIQEITGFDAKDYDLGSMIWYLEQYGLLARNNAFGEASAKDVVAYTHDEPRELLRQIQSGFYVTGRYNEYLDFIANHFNEIRIEKTPAGYYYS